jgi:hypothetical protein
MHGIRAKALVEPLIFRDSRGPPVKDAAALQIFVVEFLGVKGNSTLAAEVCGTLPLIKVVGFI